MTGVRKIRGGALLARALKEKGIEHVFTLSGGFCNPALEGFMECPMKGVNCPHEQVATCSCGQFTPFIGHSMNPSSAGLQNPPERVKTCSMPFSFRARARSAPPRILRTPVMRCSQAGQQIRGAMT